MPTYEYQCSASLEDGGHGEFEEYHSIREDAKLTECPYCRKEKDISTPVQRNISGGSGRGIVQLEGDEYKASVMKDASRIKRDVYSNENSYANVLGNDKYQALQQRMDKQR
jgi:hypothetical protein